MYFGVEALKSDKRLLLATESSVVDFDSVVYTEYLNRKSMLEACTDESQRSLLEAQVEVLCEASIKDLFKRIKDVIHNFIEWIKKIIKKVKDFFTGAKYKNALKEIEDLKAEIKSKDLANADLDKKIKDLKEELSKAQSDSAKKEEELKKANKEVEIAKHSEKFKSDLHKEEAESHSKTREMLEAEIERMENLREKLAKPDPIIFFNATNYIRRDISPQSLARCASEVMGKLDSDRYSDNHKEALEKWIEKYGSKLYILNDETEKRLGNNSMLDGGYVDHVSLNNICREDMEKKASEFKGDLVDLFKIVDINEFAKTSWLSEIMDGYEIFAQNLMKTVEKEFDVKYRQSLGNNSDWFPNEKNIEDSDEYNAKYDATEANDLFKKANKAIELAKASVTACGTLIKFEGEAIGACRQLCKVIKTAITA